jgi:hypothetical protein
MCTAREYCHVAGPPAWPAAQAVHKYAQSQHFTLMSCTKIILCIQDLQNMHASSATMSNITPWPDSRILLQQLADTACTV